MELEMPFPSPFPAPTPWQTGPGEEGAAPGAVAQLSSWPGTAVQSRIKREQNRLAPIPAVQPPHCSEGPNPTASSTGVHWVLHSSG